MGALRHLCVRGVSLVRSEMIISALICCAVPTAPCPGSSSPRLRARTGSPAASSHRRAPREGAQPQVSPCTGTKGDVTLTVSRISMFPFSFPPSTVSPASKFCAARGCHDVLFPSLLGPRAAVPCSEALLPLPHSPSQISWWPRVTLPRPATCAL